MTQLAVRQEQITRLGEVLKSAGLKPVSYTLGLAALPAVPTALAEVCELCGTTRPTLARLASDGIALSEVEAEQKEMLKIVRRLADEGQIVMGGGGGDEYL